MKTTQLMMAALLATALTPTMAREAAGVADERDTAPVKTETVRQRFIQQAGEKAVQGFEHAGFAGPLMALHGKPVKNAPYSAEVVAEQQQNLPDGNQIVSKSSSMSYRDSAGRTRQEKRDANGNVRHITINDPVEGTTYLLNPDTRTATKIGPQRDIARLAGEKARVQIEEMGKPGAGHEQIIVKRVERMDGEAGQKLRENVRIQVSKELTEGQGMERLEKLAPLLAGSLGDMKWSAKSTLKDLGVKDIEGVKAQGKLRSYEIPAGEIGNRNAIVVSTETWYAPDLQVTVLTRRIDPRNGEHTYRLAGLKREEPAPALFTVPGDYTVKDVMATIKKKMDEAK
ncbi:MAG: hypothetical protein ACJ8GW_17745 [Massilia sp.]